MLTERLPRYTLVCETGNDWKISRGCQSLKWQNFSEPLAGKLAFKSTVRLGLGSTKLLLNIIDDMTHCPIHCSSCVPIFPLLYRCSVRYFSIDVLLFPVLFFPLVRWWFVVGKKPEQVGPRLLIVGIDPFTYYFQSRHAATPTR